MWSQENKHSYFDKATSALQNYKRKYMFIRQYKQFNCF